MGKSKKLNGMYLVEEDECIVIDAVIKDKDTGYALMEWLESAIENLNKDEGRDDGQDDDASEIS